MIAFSAATRVGGERIPSLDILVVDDDELNQRLMRVLLAREGHHVETASNGLEAIEAVKHKRYDIVFMDLQMPGMDGIEASRRIRAWENGGPHTFIVALTASYLPENGQMLFEAGMDNYISKPFEIEHIQKLLKYSAQARYHTPNGKSGGSINTQSTQATLDTQLGVQQSGGNPEIYQELLLDFVQELPGKIRLIRDAYEAREMEKLSRAAHNLKGVSANLGAAFLSGLAGRLEEQTNAGETENLWQTIEGLETAASVLLDQADVYLKDHKHGK